MEQFPGHPLVSIKCTVYNHEPYLRQCLDGFVMQQTNFPFEAIVHDDASTDGSAAIIREYAEKYPHIIRPIYETENQYSKGNLTRIMRLAMHPASKYVAVCEGDDYWTDPLKLQKQVDIMEQDPEVGLVHTLAQVYYQSLGRIGKEVRGEPINSLDDLIRDNRCVTLTACFRKDLFLDYILNHFNAEFWYKRGWRTGDYPQWIFFAANAKTHFIPEVTGVYRLLPNSACHLPDINNQVDFELKVLDVKTFFAKLYHREHLLKDITTDFVKQMQFLSIERNETVDYDIKSLNKQFGLHSPALMLAKHYMLKSDLLRNLYIKVGELKSLVRR